MFRGFRDRADGIAADKHGNHQYPHQCPNAFQHAHHKAVFAPSVKERPKEVMHA